MLLLPSGCAIWAKSSLADFEGPKLLLIPDKFQQVLWNKSIPSAAPKVTIYLGKNEIKIASRFLKGPHIMLISNKRGCVGLRALVYRTINVCPEF